jgi:hypothetical protein
MSGAEFFSKINFPLTRELSLWRQRSSWEVGCEEGWEGWFVFRFFGCLLEACLKFFWGFSQTSREVLAKFSRHSREVLSKSSWSSPAPNNDQLDLKRLSSKPYDILNQKHSSVKSLSHLPHSNKIQLPFHLCSSEIQLPFPPHSTAEIPRLKPIAV